MASTFYVVHDTELMGGRFYTYDRVDFDDDDSHNVTEVLEKLEADNPNDESCETSLWDDYNTFNEVYEVVDDEDSYEYLSGATPISDDDDKSAEEKLMQIVNDYTNNGCEDDPNAVNRSDDIDY